MESYDAIVIGAGVIGSSVAYHLARFGARRVLVLDRTQIGAGTTSQSSGILRTHYSVMENVEMAKASGFGWIDYDMRNPRPGRIEEKSVYFERVDEVVVSVTAGRDPRRSVALRDAFVESL